MSSWALLPLGLGMAILDGHLSFLSEPVQFSFGVVFGLWSLGLGLGMNLPKFDLRLSLLPSIATVALAALCLFASEPSVRPLGPLLCWIAGFSLRDSPLLAREETILFASLFTMASNFGLSLIPPFWNFSNHLVNTSTEWITAGIGTSLSIGPAALPVSSAILVLASVFLSRAPSHIRWWRVCRLGATFLGMFLIQCVALSILARDSSLRIETGWALTAVMNFLGTVAILTHGIVVLQSQTGPNEEVRQPRLSASVVAGTIAGILTVTALWHPPTTSRLGEILILAPSETLDINHAYRVIPSGYGSLHEIGMFGQWARLLSQLGYQAKTQVGMPTAEDLVGVRVVCMFAPSATWASEPTKLKLLQEFVEKGGSLLVFAEHTNYQSNALVLNHLLDPFGIRVNFDTTNGGFGEDLRGVRLWQSQFRHALRMLAAFPYNRGASLSLHGAARPLMVGRPWQGDTGNFWADDQGFLGDYRVGPGDRWGDLILAAEWQGKDGGRVLVFGDTTPFMNAALGYTAPAVTPILQILLSPATTIGWEWGALMGILIVGALAWLGKLYPHIHSPIAVIAVASFAVGVGILETQRSIVFLPENERTFVVVTDILNQIDLSVYGDRAPTALMIEATRVGLLPLAIPLQPVPSKRPTVVLLLAPRRTLTTYELTLLEKWVEAGTTVIVAADGSVSPARAVLRQLGVTLGNVPLGNILLDDPNSLAVHLQSAWPLQLNGDWRPLRHYRGSVVIAERRLGQGRFVLSSDEGIAMNLSLATERTVSPSNLEWWGALLREANGRS